MTYYNGKIYAQTGNYRLDFWEYTISGGTWRRLEDMSGYLGNNVGPYTGAAIASNGSGTIYSVWAVSYTHLDVYKRQFESIISDIKRPFLFTS